MKNAAGAVIPRLSTREAGLLVADSVAECCPTLKPATCLKLKKLSGRVRIFPAARAEVLSEFYFTKGQVCGTEVHWRMSLASVIH